MTQAADTRDDLQPRSTSDQHEADTATSEIDVDAVGRRVEGLLDEIADADPTLSRVAEELVTELVGLYGVGLARLVDRLMAAVPGAIDEMAEDPVLTGLLALHDLHPGALEERIEIALDECRPYLESHKGGVTLLGVDDGMVRLRLEGTCDGCGASETTMKNAVEAAILSVAPEVVGIDVEGLVPLGEGHAPPPGGPPPPLVGAGSMGSLPLHPSTGGG